MLIKFNLIYQGYYRNILGSGAAEISQGNWLVKENLLNYKSRDHR